MTEHTRAQCSSCKADIIWSTSEKGSAAPIDFQPSPDGTVALEYRGSPTPLSRVVPVKHRFGRTDLRKSHFATCPEAARHRRGRAR